MANPKIIHALYSTQVLKKSSFSTRIQADLDLVRKYENLILNTYRNEFSQILLDKFIEDTYFEIRQWNLEKRLNGSIAFSGPLRYAFLAGTFSKFAKDFPNRNVFFILGEEPFTRDQFDPIPTTLIAVNGELIVRDKPLPSQISPNEYTINPYIMHTDPYLNGYSGYLKK